MRCVLGFIYFVIVAIKKLERETELIYSIFIICLSKYAVNIKLCMRLKFFYSEFLE